MTKSTITDERITSVIERMEHFASNLKWTDVRGAQDLLTAADGLRELQELRKAAMDSEPVAYIFKHPAGRLFWALTDESNKGQNDVMPVYASPQPVPVVPDERPSLNNGIVGFDEGWNACRAAMLNGGKS